MFSFMYRRRLPNGDMQSSSRNLWLAAAWSRMPKVVRWAWASFAGYFWLPCPRCGRMYGGMEDSAGSEGNRSTCYRCHGDRPEGRR